MPSRTGPIDDEFNHKAHAEAEHNISTADDVDYSAGTPTTGQVLGYDQTTGLWSPLTPGGLTFSGAFYYGTVTISSNSTASMAGLTMQYDTDSYYSTPYFTIPTTGVYVVSAGAASGFVAADKQIRISFQDNASSTIFDSITIGQTAVSRAADQYCWVNITTGPVEFTAGDQFRPVIFNGDSSSQDFECFFSIDRRN